MKIFIAGLGLIGGSYAQGLTANGHIVYGYDPHEPTLNYALSHHYIKDAGIKYLKESDVIILGFYPQKNVEFVRMHLGLFVTGQVITDVSGIKKTMVGQIEDLLTKGVNYCSHHPMAGKEKRGIEHANWHIFKGTNFITIETPNTTLYAITVIQELGKQLGFNKISTLSKEEHDELIGYTSQLPHAMAVALVNSNTHDKTASFTGDSYRDLTRIAVINELLWSELFLDNKVELLSAIRVFEQELDKIKNALETNDKDALKQLFIQSTKRRSQLK